MLAQESLPIRPCWSDASRTHRATTSRPSGDVESVQSSEFSVSGVPSAIRAIWSAAGHRRSAGPPSALGFSEHRKAQLGGQLVCRREDLDPGHAAHRDCRAEPRSCRVVGSRPKLNRSWATAVDHLGVSKERTFSSKFFTDHSMPRRSLLLKGCRLNGYLRAMRRFSGSSDNHFFFPPM